MPPLGSTQLMIIGILFALAVGPPAQAQNNPPVVSNVVASQRQDASKLVDITYDLAAADGGKKYRIAGSGQVIGPSPWFWLPPQRLFDGGEGRLGCPTTACL
jgi:hypothetical protein